MEIFDYKSQNDIFDQKCPKSIEYDFFGKRTTFTQKFIFFINNFFASFENFSSKILERNYEIRDFSSKLIISSFE